MAMRRWLWVMVHWVITHSPPNSQQRVPSSMDTYSLSRLCRNWSYGDKVHDTVYAWHALWHGGMACDAVLHAAADCNGQHGSMGGPTTFRGPRSGIHHLYVLW